MSISGISVAPDIIKKYEAKRMQNQEGELILKIADEAIQIENEFTQDFASVVNALPKEEPRYVLYDVPIKNRANLDDLRTVFIAWIPLESPVRLRMIYSSTKSVITSNFRGISTSLLEDEGGKLSLEYLQDKIKKTQGINNPVY